MYVLKRYILIVGFTTNSGINAKEIFPQRLSSSLRKSRKLTNSTIDSKLDGEDKASSLIRDKKMLSIFTRVTEKLLCKVFRFEKCPSRNGFRNTSSVPSITPSVSTSRPSRIHNDVFIVTPIPSRHVHTFQTFKPTIVFPEHPPDINSNDYDHIVAADELSNIEFDNSTNSEPKNTSTTNDPSETTSSPFSITDNSSTHVPTTKPKPQNSSNYESTLYIPVSIIHSDELTEKNSTQPLSASSDQTTKLRNPSMLPSVQFSTLPTIHLSGTPSIHRSGKPSVGPTRYSSPIPSVKPSNAPTGKPTTILSMSPTMVASNVPTMIPSNVPSSQHSWSPSDSPSLDPSANPTNTPSYGPTEVPSTSPTDNPSSVPSPTPSLRPSRLPSTEPSELPSMLPTNFPSVGPTHTPSEFPSDSPTHLPSHAPTLVPTTSPSSSPSARPVTPEETCVWGKNKAPVGASGGGDNNCVHHMVSIHRDAGARTIVEGDYICSPNGSFRFGLTADHFLCLCEGQRKVWCANECCQSTRSSSSAPYVLLEDNGNLAVYAKRGSLLGQDKVIWESKTATEDPLGNRLKLKNNGDLTITPLMKEDDVLWKIEK